jgi:hypothetical protein
VTQLTDNLFDAIEFDAARGGDHLTAAQLMSRLAGTADPDGGMSRAEAYLRAGEQWLLADDPAKAADAFRLAIADGGATFVDPRVPLARALYLLDEPEQAATLVAQLKAEGPRDPLVCDLVGELLLEQSDLPGALAWVTAGVELCLPGGVASVPPSALAPDVGAELRLLLSLRYRIRNDLSLPEDEYDQMIDELADGEGAPTARSADAGGGGADG